ncbi:TPA: hypothetical protein ACGHRI_001345, partial [Shigella boydii]
KEQMVVSAIASTPQVLSASSYSPDEWERQCTAAGKTQ